MADGRDYERALDAENPYSDPVGALRRTLIETRVYNDPREGMA